MTDVLQRVAGKAHNKTVTVAEFCTLPYGGQDLLVEVAEHYLPYNGAELDSASDALTATNIHHGTPWAGTIERVTVFVNDDTGAGVNLDRVRVFVAEVAVFDSGTGLNISQDEAYEGAPGDSIALDDRLAIGCTPDATDTINYAATLLLKKASPPKQCPYCRKLGIAISVDIETPHGPRHTYWCIKCDREVRGVVWDRNTGKLRRLWADVTDPERIVLCCGQSKIRAEEAGRVVQPAGFGWKTKPRLRPGQRWKINGGGKLVAGVDPNWKPRASLLERIAQLEAQVKALAP